MAAIAVMACVCGGTLASAQQPGASGAAQPSTTQAGGAGQPQVALPLEGPTAMVFHVVKAEMAAEFESLFSRMRDALLASRESLRRDQGAGWTLFKQNAPTAEGHLLYVSVIDPVVPSAEYDIARLLAEAYPEQGADLYRTLLASHVKPTVQATSLTRVIQAEPAPDASSPAPPGEDVPATSASDEEPPR